MKKVSRFSALPKGTYGNVAPPSFSNPMNQPRLAVTAAPQAPSRPVRDYFDDDEDEPIVDLKSSAGTADDDDYDPLDDFMSGIQEQVKQQASTPSKPANQLPEIVSGQFDDDSEFEESVAKSATTKAGTKGGVTAEDLDELEGYLNGTAGATTDSKTRIEPLPALDHSTIIYAPFKKQFYTPGAELSALSAAEVATMREELDLHVTPHTAPCPLQTFRQANFDTKLLNEILAVGYEMPTAIQAQAIPLAMSGYDVIGLAKTGSGKTLAYLWPMIVHILAQPQMKLGDGPIGLVLAPTRELAQQIHVEAKKFATKVYNIRTVAVYGGGGKWEMSKALKDECPEIVIATPGRFIEMVRNKSTNLLRVTMVVLDEADRMFELGFEYQMLSILHNIRPDRQVLMFSATMKRKIESFAREITKNEVKIVVGNPGMSNTDIVQSVHICSTYNDKLTWLKANIDLFAAEGKVLIFVLSKVGTEEVCGELQRYFKVRDLDINVACIHGDKNQSERNSIIHQYSKKHINDDTTTTTTTTTNTATNTNNITILIATDIASRGLDIKNIRTVINFDVAKNIETYVHRIGRTGRMGIEGVTPGTAYTLLTPKDSSFACDLVQNLNISHQPVSPELLSLAQADPKWNRIRHVTAGGGYNGGSGGNSGSGKGRWNNNSSNSNNVNRGGLGFGESGVSQGRSSVAVTSSMLAGGIPKTPLLPANYASSAGNKDESGGAYVSTLPAGMKGFQRAQHDYSSVSATNATTVNPSNYSHTAHVPITINNTSYNNTTAPSAIPIVANTDFAANPYLAGHSQGRGKHLTQPSWMNDNNTIVTASTSIVTSVNQTVGGGSGSNATSGQFADTVVKRKSRFDSAGPYTALFSAPSTSVNSEDYGGATLSGFVRPAGVTAVPNDCYNNSSTATTTDATAVGIGPSGEGDTSVNTSEGEVPRPFKRSRWDA